MRSYNSSSDIDGSVTRLTIPECPETAVATFLVLTLWVSKILLIAPATSGASIIAPSTTVSCARGSSPQLTSSYPCFVPFSSTALMELEPISRPTRAFCLEPPNISEPLRNPHAGRIFQLLLRDPLKRPAQVTLEPEPPFHPHLP